MSAGTTILKEIFREMRRNIFSSILPPRFLPAGSLWAAPNPGPSDQYLNQITEQTYQIQTQADHLEAYVRSGAHDWTVPLAYAQTWRSGAQKLLTLLDQFVAQPGATNDTRQQVEKMKSMAVELNALSVAARWAIWTSRAMALHAGEISGQHRQYRRSLQHDPQRRADSVLAR